MAAPYLSRAELRQRLRDQILAELGGSGAEDWTESVYPYDRFAETVAAMGHKHFAIKAGRSIPLESTQDADDGLLVRTTCRVKFSYKASLNITDTLADADTAEAALLRLLQAIKGVGLTWLDVAIGELDEPVIDEAGMWIVHSFTITALHTIPLIPE